MIMVLQQIRSRLLTIDIEIDVAPQLEPRELLFFPGLRVHGDSVRGWWARWTENVDVEEKKRQETGRWMMVLLHEPWMCFETPGYRWYSRRPGRQRGAREAGSGGLVGLSR